MTSLPFASLRARLLLLVGLIIVPALLLVSYTALEQRRLATAEVEEDALRLARLAAADQERLIDSMYQLLGALAQHPAVRQYDTTACNGLFSSLLKRYPHYANLGAFRPNGDLYCSGLPGRRRGFNAAHRYYFLSALHSRSFTVGDYQMGRASGKPVLTAAYPVLDTSGQVQAVLFAGLDLTWVNRLLATAQLPEGSIVTVVDRNGRILARFPDARQWIGKAVPELPLVNVILSHHEGVAAANGIDGVPRLFGYTPMRSAPFMGHLYISIGIPTGQAYAHVNRMLARNLATLIAIALLLLLTIWVGSNLLILRPIQALLQATRRLSAGDLDARAGLPRGNAELSQLGQAFDAMAESLQRLTRQNRLILDAAGEGIYGLDTDGRVTFVNPAAAKMFGCTAEELIGHTLHDLTHHSRPDGTPYPAADCPIYAAFKDGTAHQVIEEAFWRKDGSTFPVEYVSTPLREDQRLVGAVVVFKDITERQAQAAALEHQALHDTLTGMPNRVWLHKRLQMAILERHQAQGGQKVAILLMDLNRFKVINDTLGHHNGDQLLQQVGRRLQETLEAPIAVARLGGDEFGMLLPAVSSASEATRTARQVLKVLEEPFLLEGMSLDVRTSIGIALAPDHGEDSNALLQRADVAMYEAKQAGIGYALYAAEHDHYNPRRLALMGELRQAIDDDQLFLVYQPKISFKTGRITSVEALVRWQHAQHGTIPPDQFISIAEQIGLIRSLTLQVLNTALRQCREWHRAGLPLAVAVNLSPRNLEDQQLPEKVAQLLATWELGAQWLVLEITEGTIMMDPERSLDILKRLSAMGVELSIDDFGTGYSSLSYLKKLPVNELKIDQSFVRGVVDDKDDAMIVRSTIELGHHLGHRIVAEGVETQEIWAKLTSLGCDLAQGFLFSHPLSAADLATWLHDSPWGWTPPLRSILLEDIRELEVESCN